MSIGRRDALGVPIPPQAMRSKPPLITGVSWDAATLIATRGVLTWHALDIHHDLGRTPGNASIACFTGELHDAHAAD